jgi:hypothetical protein
MRPSFGAAVLLVAALAAVPAHAQSAPAGLGLSAGAVVFPGHPLGEFATDASIDIGEGRAGLWADVGARWQGVLSASPVPAAAGGVRFRTRRAWVTIGVSTDVGYAIVGGDSGAAATPGGIIAASQRLDSISLAIPSGQSDPVTATPTSARGGYTSQRVTDILARAEWSVHPISLRVSSGWRIGGPVSGHPWISAAVAVPVTSSMSLVAGIDQHRRFDASTAPPAFSLGVEIGHTRRHRMPDVKPPQLRAALGDGIVRVVAVTGGVVIEYQDADAASVRLRGDLTGWRDVAFAHATGGVWRVELSGAPGTYRVVMSRNGGGWMPLPGLPETLDGFGAKAGLLVIDR